MNSTQRDKLALGIILLVAIGLRAGMLVMSGENLGEDRDGYLKIADHLAAGEGYSTSGADQPTAFRPPLYPVVIALLRRVGSENMTLGLLHLMLGVATVYLTFVIGCRLKLGRASLLAAAAVAVDPLLLQYTTLPMTEVLCAFLVTLLLFLMLNLETVKDGSGQKRKAESGKRNSVRFATGFAFGLCALCRPTIWVFGGLYCLHWLIRTRRTSAGVPLSPFRFPLCQFPWPALLALAITVSPWLIRNMIVFGHPVLTTTHGGYTLLLGNNRVFYAEVVDAPWGTVWNGDSLRAWQDSLETQMAREARPVVGETGRDRWMYGQARQHIRDNPGTFARACLLRIVRFWNIVPLEPARQSLPLPVVWGVGIFYGILTCGLLLATWGGLNRLKRAAPLGEARAPTSTEHSRPESDTIWVPLVLLIAGFSLVHLFYWSNLRMRAPLIPAIALLAIHGWCSRMKR